ncbi:alpha/beta hydrolase [Mycobacterium sp. Y57]|uniref:alpha/beta fold hydrolase n=1 Tax=Mycolicibacterium xanthum TaxID=2796469 RepID=UPI001C8539AB|nr:alpha/beta hydrolase [Mycolicibacterium xanthum]MBX7434190.1 alpha/beta hydrolase [Mycolicibacterium xanthum]
MESERSRVNNPPRHRHTDVSVMTGDGVRLAVRDYGTRVARHTVVLLHGLCVSDEVWSLQLDHLLGRDDGDIRVITYDHRGHGRSDRAAAESYRIERLAGDLADILEALEVVGPTTLVGHSMGGMVALAYLARSESDRPVDPHGLVLVTTAAGKLAERGLGRLLATPGAGALLGLINHIPKQALEALVGPVCSTLGKIFPAQRVMLAKVAEAAATTPVPTAAGFVPALREFDQHPSLPDIGANTVVVSGGADPLTPETHARELADAIPGAVHVHLPGAGHMLPSEAPDTVNDAIRRAMLPDGAARSRHRGSAAGSGPRTGICVESVTTRAGFTPARMGA